jgi:hypothetical protein
VDFPRGEENQKPYVSSEMTTCGKGYGKPQERLSMFMRDVHACCCSMRRLHCLRRLRSPCVFVVRSF